MIVVYDLHILIQLIVLEIFMSAKFDTNPIMEIWTPMIY